MSLLRKLAPPLFAAVILLGFVLQIHPPQVNVSWKMPFGVQALADGVTGNGAYPSYDGTTICPGSTVGLCNPITVGVTFNTITPLTFNDTGGTAVLTAVAVPSTVVPQLGFTTTDGANCLTNSTNLFVRFLASAQAVSIKCNGAVSTSNGIINNTAGNIISNASGAALGQMLAGTNVTDANMTGGAFIVGNGGMYEQGTTCTGTLSNAVPSLATVTQFGCFLNASAGSATATQYLVTFPTEAGVRTNLPLCFVQEVAGASIVGNTCVLSAANPMVANINFTVAPTTTGRFNIWVVGNGP